MGRRCGPFAEQLPGLRRLCVTSLDAMLERDLRNFWANLAPTWRGGDIDALKTPAAPSRDRGLSRPSLSAALPPGCARRSRVVVATAPTVTVLLLAHGVRPMSS